MYNGPTSREKVSPQSFDEISDVKEPKYLWYEAKINTPLQEGEYELKTPVRIQGSGIKISTHA